MTDPTNRTTYYVQYGGRFPNLLQISEVKAPSIRKSPSIVLCTVPYIRTVLLPSRHSPCHAASAGPASRHTFLGFLQNDLFGSSSVCASWQPDSTPTSSLTTCISPCRYTLLLCCISSCAARFLYSIRSPNLHLPEYEVQAFRILQQFMIHCSFQPPYRKRQPSIPADWSSS